MGHEMKMGQDGILRVKFSGFLDGEEAEAYIREYEGYVKHATVDEPLHTLSDAQEMTKMSSSARKLFIESFSSPDVRVGKTAIVGASRYLRVLAGFILKAVGRDNIRLFASEEEALPWLVQESG
jgi:hypothetical protein